MARPDRPRPLLLPVLVAVVLGFVLGWVARVWWTPSPEQRARDTMGEMRERVREFTR